MTFVESWLGLSIPLKHICQVCTWPGIGEQSLEYQKSRKTGIERLSGTASWKNDSATILSVCSWFKPRKVNKYCLDGCQAIYQHINFGLIHEITLGQDTNGYEITRNYVSLQHSEMLICDVLLKLSMVSGDLVAKHSGTIFVKAWHIRPSLSVDINWWKKFSYAFRDTFAKFEREWV